MNHVAGYLLIGIVVMLIDILVDWKTWERLFRMDGVVASIIVGIITYGSLWPFYIINAIMCAVEHTWETIFKGESE